MSSSHSEHDAAPDPGGDLSAVVIACALVSLAISAIAVAARFYTRIVIVRVLAAEDWFIFAAWVLSVGTTVGTILQAKSALGHHASDLAPKDFLEWGRASWLTTLFYQLSLACSKVSILLLYIQILTYNYARRAAYFVLAIVVIYNVAGFISSMTLCIPIQAQWDPTIKGKCHREPRYMWLFINLHIATDFLIFLLPIPVVLRMSARLGQKLILLFIFSLGLLICIISILRAAWINALFKSKDPSWDFVAVSNWNSIEVNTAIVCVCLLVTKPLFVKLWERVRPKPPTTTSETASSSGTADRSDSGPRRPVYPSSREQLFEQKLPG